ncbi:MAG: FkbM family methyltransferase [Thalassobaculum sp.]|uniref:FkbM family methyltransferase n=1 Tax=Thalassobaculum sp. TaxID=2022740 RepID=UPI0032ED1A6B
MSATDVSRTIEQARTLIAQRRTKEARAALAPYRGIPAIVGPIEMLVGYSQLIDVDLPGALATLRKIPTRLEPSVSIAVGRLLMTCGGAGIAFDRFRRILVGDPAAPVAAAAVAEAAGMVADPATALGLAAQAQMLGARPEGLLTTKLRALVELERYREAVDLVGLAASLNHDVDSAVSMVANLMHDRPNGIASVNRLAGGLDPALLRRLKLAHVAAAAAFHVGQVERAAALLDAVQGRDPSGAELRHEIALELGDARSAARALATARSRLLEAPDAPDAILVLLTMLLHSADHDRAEILRLARRAAWLLGTGLTPGPDMAFAECVRLKNDMSLRTSGHGLRLAHALGALAAGATFGGNVAVRRGATHAHIAVAGRHLRLRLTSPQIRSSAGILYALEPGMLLWFAGFSPDDVLVDIGANIGMFTVLAAGLSGCRVIALEPFSLNVADLDHNVAVNGLQDRVTVMHAAASDRERIDTLYFGQDYAGAANQSFGRDDISEQYDDRDADREEVRGVPIDVLVARGEIPFPSHVKIDVDGFEEQVIEGMRGILADPRFKSLRMEIRWHEAERRKLVDSIVDQGYSVAIADDAKNLLFTRLPAA